MIHMYNPFIKNTTAILAAGSLLVGLLAGCSGSQSVEQKAPEAKSKDPIELTLTPVFLNMTDEEFNEVMIKPLKAKYPHITLKIVRDDINKLVAAGQTPDIIYSANSRFAVMKELDIPSDLSALVKSNNMDLNQFSSPNIDWIKDLGPKGEIFGLPFALNQMALFYNKDLFDKRGVPYPKDGITWDEYYELAKKLTYNEDGVQFRGTLPTNPEFFTRLRSLSMVDPQTNKPLLNTEPFNVVFETVQALYQIPGMVQNEQVPPDLNSFVKDHQSAMYLNWIPDTVGFLQKAGGQMNFDLVGAPTFKDKPGITVDHGAQMMIVSKSSKHKEEAFQAIQLFTSPEVQSILNRKSRLTVLADESLTKDFLADVEMMKGKNIQGALKVKSAKMVPPNPYTVIVAGKLNAAVNQMISGKKDLNTIIRETQEEAEKAVEQELANKKK
jgi:multiple sugar transport system substrate-binding protein